MGGVKVVVGPKPERISHVSINVWTQDELRSIWRRDKLRAAADKVKQKESCGFVLDSGLIIEARNIASRPTAEFEIDPETHMDVILKHRKNILGVWHTHPSNTPSPSRGDVVGWPGVPEWSYFIVTRDLVAEWRKEPFDERTVV